MCVLRVAFKSTRDFSDGLETRVNEGVRGVFAGKAKE